MTALLSFVHGASPVHAVCNKTVGTRTFEQCQDLAALGATYAWSLNNDTNSVDFAFSEDMQVTGGWIGWGINPTKGPNMEGTQALIAFKNGTSLIVMEYDVTNAVKDGAPLLPTLVSVKYSNLSAVMVKTTVTIFGTFPLGAGKAATVDHVWNRGRSVNPITFELAEHPLAPANLASVGTVDLATGIASVVGPPHQKLENAHGVISAVAWGILVPIGVMAARYLRPFPWADPLWFYLHITCQLTGYTLGVVGWGLGLQLQKYASPIKYFHRNVGISIFVFATLQVLAMVLRPKRGSKHRRYWNMYHHTVGYATIILSIVNIFEGLDLLQPESKWKDAYIGVLVALAVIAALLETAAWVAWLRRSKGRIPESPPPPHLGSKAKDALEP